MCRLKEGIRSHFRHLFQIHDRKILKQKTKSTEVKKNRRVMETQKNERDKIDRNIFPQSKIQSTLNTLKGGDRNRFQTSSKV